MFITHTVFSTDMGDNTGLLCQWLVLCYFTIIVKCFIRLDTQYTNVFFHKWAAFKTGKRKQVQWRLFVLFPKEMLWRATDQSWFSNASGCKRTVKRSTEPKQDNWCWVDTLFVVPAIEVRSIPSHVLHAANYYIAFCFLLLRFITERQLSLEESRSPQMNSKKREGASGPERTENPCILHWKGGRPWTKTHCPWI